MPRRVPPPRLMSAHSPKANTDPCIPNPTLAVVRGKDATPFGPIGSQSPLPRRMRSQRACGPSFGVPPRGSGWRRSRAEQMPSSAGPTANPGAHSQSSITEDPQKRMAGENGAGAGVFDEHTARSHRTAILLAAGDRSARPSQSKSLGCLDMPSSPAAEGGRVFSGCDGGTRVASTPEEAAATRPNPHGQSDSRGPTTRNPTADTTALDKTGMQMRKCTARRAGGDRDATRVGIVGHELEVAPGCSGCSAVCGSWSGCNRWLLPTPAESTGPVPTPDAAAREGSVPAPARVGSFDDALCAPQGEGGVLNCELSGNTKTGVKVEGLRRSLDASHMSRIIPH